MTDVDLLPCGDPIADSLFEVKGGSRVLLALPPLRTEWSVVSCGSVWCVDHGWQDAPTVEEYERLKAVVA